MSTSQFTWHSSLNLNKIQRAMTCSFLPKSHNPHGTILTWYKHKISGSKRTYENNTQVGEVYFGDIAYLPQSRRGYRFCLLIVERLTSFVSAIPLKSLNAESTSNAIRLFVGIIGFSMSKFCSDYGVNRKAMLRLR